MTALVIVIDVKAVSASADTAASGDKCGIRFRRQAVPPGSGSSRAGQAAISSSE
jgi:hypothetical protein